MTAEKGLRNRKWEKSGQFSEGQKASDLAEDGWLHRDRIGKWWRHGLPRPLQLKNSEAALPSQLPADGDPRAAKPVAMKAPFSM